MSAHSFSTPECRPQNGFLTGAQDTKGVEYSVGDSRSKKP